MAEEARTAFGDGGGFRDPYIVPAHGQGMSGGARVGIVSAVVFGSVGVVLRGSCGVVVGVR